MKQLIGIEHKTFTNRETGEISESDVLHIADYESKEGLQGAVTEQHRIYNWKDIEVQGKLELGCAIRIFREGSKDYSKITVIMCSPWTKK